MTKSPADVIRTQSRADVIRAQLRLQTVPGTEGIVLHMAHQGSRLSRLSGNAAPYWAYPWAGGLALVRHLIAHPGLVAQRHVLDLGAGSGLVGIAAARAGAVVSAVEVDGYGQAAIGLNAGANGVAIVLMECDIDGPAPDGIDLVVAGDVFYNATIGARMLAFLERCAARGMDVLIGDPGRRDLPAGRLEQIASYSVGDVGDKAERIAGVYRLARKA